MQPKTRVVQIFEITTAAVEPLDAWFRAHRSLRGTMIELMRRGGKVNGMLRSSICDGPYPIDALPAAPDVKQILRTLWSIKDQNGVLTQDRFSADPVKPFKTVSPDQKIIPGGDDLGGRLHEGNGHAK